MNESKHVYRSHWPIIKIEQSNINKTMEPAGRKMFFSVTTSFIVCTFTVVYRYAVSSRFLYLH